MSEHLFDEERIAVGLGLDQVDQFGRWCLARPATEHLRDFLARQQTQWHLDGLASAEEVGECPVEGTGKIEIGVPVGAYDKKWDRRKTRRQMLQQQQARFVGPVEVLEHQHQRPGFRRAFEKRLNALQEILPLLLRRQARWFGDVVVALSQDRHQLRQFGGILADRHPHAFRG